MVANHLPKAREVFLHRENGILGMGPGPAPGGEDYDLINAGRRRRAHAEDAVFAMQENLAVLRQMIGHHGRQPDAEIDIGAFGNILGDARGHLVAVPFVHAASFDVSFLNPAGPVALRATLTMRCTKMPGVTTASGSRAPSSTTSCTEAMVSLAALAMIGPKLRAALRYTRLPQRSPASALISATSAWIGISSTYMRPSISRVSLPLASSVP